MTRPIPIKGFRIGKGGRVERDPKRLPVNLRLKQRDSKKVCVARPVIRREAATQ